MSVSFLGSIVGCGNEDGQRDSTTREATQRPQLTRADLRALEKGHALSARWNKLSQQFVNVYAGGEPQRVAATGRRMIPRLISLVQAMEANAILFDNPQLRQSVLALARIYRQQAIALRDMVEGLESGDMPAFKRARARLAAAGARLRAQVLRNADVLRAWGVSPR